MPSASERDGIERLASAEFDRWAQAGRGESMARGHADIVSLALDRWSLGAESRILDLGCGVGGALESAVARGAGAVAGLDIAPAMVARAQARLPGADIRVGSGEALPWSDESFTHVLSVEALYYYSDPVQALREARRVMVPEGRVGVLIELYTDNAGSRVWADVLDVEVKLWSEARWREAFAEAGLRDVVSARMVRRQAPPSETEFEPSRWYPTLEHYRTYLREGALWVEGRR